MQTITHVWAKRAATGGSSWSSSISSFSTRRDSSRLPSASITTAFAWTRDAVDLRGWRYEVWSEPDPHLLENIGFLAGYRRDWLFDAELLNALRVVGLEGMSLGEAFLVPAYPRPLVKAAVLHLLWLRPWPRPGPAAHR
ncbi:hypothetical protein [Streptomyces fulvorobeus]|uniref:Uncharacterized protein n=1 Tax=Streptomyces fulvorobeus TaxID=284028 RepID=A0A7J0CFR1_9ACTN|nr:hypothetical protein [Streptomyces fulvorobeus]NYE44778.1 hypothetical protein [Streptomyces fulvorobeus]GFN01341.1 hypothetical protein Sfulv_61510 [Streptomyces fulvorobeus]